MHGSDEAFEYLSRCLHLNPREKVVMSARLGLGGLRLTLHEIGNVLGVTEERVRQIQWMVTRRDKAGVVSKFKSQFPSKLMLEYRTPKRFGKKLLLVWIKESGSRWCPRCLGVFQIEEFSQSNGMCVPCRDRRNAAYREANPDKIRKIKRAYYGRGYVPLYYDKLVVKRMNRE